MHPDSATLRRFLIVIRDSRKGHCERVRCWNTLRIRCDLRCFGGCLTREVAQVQIRERHSPKAHSPKRFASLRMFRSAWSKPPVYGRTLVNAPETPRPGTPEEHGLLPN